MVSYEKLIKQGIRKTDRWFEQFKKRVNRDIELSDNYQEFIERTQAYTTQNPLMASGYAEEMSSLAVRALANHKFQRASQRELLEQTINNNVGMLIQNVGEDIKETVRSVVKQGYDEGLHPREIGKNISKEIDTINNTRARTIARTEVKRTDTVAAYIRHKENGAIGFVVQCRPDCCPLCAETYDEELTADKQQETLDYIKELEEYNANVEDPKDRIYDPLLDGKGETIGGDVQFTMDETDMLPPLHPNCNCSARYIYD